MAGISITLELDAAEATARLQGLLDRMDRRKPLFEAIGDELLRSTSDNFRNQRGPDGRAWTPHRPATIKARQRKGQLPLTILRANTRGTSGSTLAGSINKQATEDELRVGSPVEYAAIHQLGGTIARKARAAKIYRMKERGAMPGRRFVSKAKADDVTDVQIPAHRIVIPARPFIGVGPQDQKIILSLAERWLST